jgi:chorismate--pyruvate lyase
MSRARWHNHVNGVQAPNEIGDWLTDPASLTAKLIAHSQSFRVRRVRQQLDVCRADEAAVIGLVRPEKVHVREVLLNCDAMPVVYAHTILPLSVTRSQWPLFGGLGEKSLGTTLFGDPQVARGDLQFARMYRSHPLVQRAQQLVCDQMELRDTTPLFARRSLFFRRGGVMLVTELFLPPILGLRRK